MQLLRFAATTLIVLGLAVVAQGQTSNADAIAALASYYDAINARDYQRAYNLWESPPSSFEQFAKGFAETSHVRILVEPSVPVEGAAGSVFAQISTIVVASTSKGTDRVFAGCYVMRRSNVEDRGWHIYRANISVAPSNTKVSRLLSQVCK